MVAYQAESDLLALLRPHYARADQEGRTLLHELLATAGDIRVGDRELHITLAPLSSPHRTYAAQALCERLDQRRSSPALACACALQEQRPASDWNAWPASSESADITVDSARCRYKYRDKRLKEPYTSPPYR
jgi:hypothetical protein